MGLLIDNLSGAQLDIGDLGISIPIGANYDLEREESRIVFQSAVDGDLDSLLTAGQIQVRDPIDDVTVLSLADGRAALRAHNETHWRLGSGARIGDISDVDLTGLSTNDVLAYNGTNWTPVDSGGDVSSSANIVDHSIVRGDGGLKNIQDSNDGATVDWTIADSGRMMGVASVEDIAGASPWDADHFMLELHNLFNTGGGGGLFIRAGEVPNDIALRICDENQTVNIVDVEIEGHWVFGDYYQDALTANGTVYGIDIQHAATPMADFNTQNGGYRIGGVLLGVDDLRDADTTTVAPNVGDVLEWDGTNWVPMTPTGGMIFGSQYQYAESLTTQGTTSSTFLNKVTITTPSLPSGDYRIGWSYEWQNTNNGGDFEARVQLDNTTDLLNHREEPQDGGTEQWQHVGGFARVTSISGVHTIDLDWANNGSGTANIRKARLEIWRVA